MLRPNILIRIDWFLPLSRFLLDPLLPLKLELITVRIRMPQLMFLGLIWFKTLLLIECLPIDKLFEVPWWSLFKLNLISAVNRHNSLRNKYLTIHLLSLIFIAYVNPIPFLSLPLSLPIDPHIHTVVLVQPFCLFHHRPSVTWSALSLTHFVVLPGF